MKKVDVTTSVKPVNADEMEERGYINLVTRIRREVWWLTTNADFEEYEQHGLSATKAVLENPLVIQQTFADKEAVAGMSDEAVVFVRSYTWSEAEIDESKHQAWHNAQDSLGFLGSLFGSQSPDA